jgi:uncharacterized protein YdeI (YjbR/CyaY-like superfamily)
MACPAKAPEPMPESALARFKTPAAFRAWLREHHTTTSALVVRIAKTHASASGVTYAQALDEALCFGWIDGVRRRLDDDGFSIRFTPRKPRSIWSRVNVAHVERLIREKRMTTAGMAAFDARQEGRTGVYAFEQQTPELSAEYSARFAKRRAAWRYFEGAAPWYRRTASHWVMSAKREETRRKRLETLIACSAEGTRIPQLRRD